MTNMDGRRTLTIFETYVIIQEVSQRGVGDPASCCGAEGGMKWRVEWSSMYFFYKLNGPRCGRHDAHAPMYPASWPSVRPNYMPIAIGKWVRYEEGRAKWSTYGRDCEISGWSLKACQVECFTSFNWVSLSDQVRDSPSKADQTTFHIKEFLGSWAIGGRPTATSYLAHSKMMSFAGFKNSPTFVKGNLELIQENIISCRQRSRHLSGFKLGNCAILQEIGKFVVPWNSSKFVAESL